MAMAYQIKFWYHVSKALAPLEVGYAPTKIQQSCADVDIVEKIFRNLAGSFKSSPRYLHRGEDFQELGGVLS